MVRRPTFTDDDIAEEETSAEERENICAAEAAGFPLRAPFGYEPIEDLTLNVLRCLFEVYRTGSGEGWEIALQTAERELGAIDGALLVAHVTSFLRALRAEGPGSFNYLGIGCHHICPDELAVLTLLKAMRLREGGIQSNMLRIIIGDDRECTRLLCAAECIAAFTCARSPRSDYGATEVSRSASAVLRSRGKFH